MDRIDMLGPVDAAADENEAVAIEDTRSHAGTVGEVFEAGHFSFPSSR
jgi:hypothetical protein